MAHVRVTATVPVNAETLWQRVGSFQGVGDWHPLLATVEGHGEQPGAIRKPKTPDGQEQTERLQEINPREHVYRYTIVSTPMPVKHYVAELRVNDNRDGTSTVVWMSDFQVDPKEEEKTVAIVHDFLKAGVDALKQEYRPPSSLRQSSS